MMLIKQFFSHKPILILLAIMTVGLGFLEYMVTRNSIGNLSAESLSSASVTFLFANIASLGVTLWALIWLMSRETKQVIPLSISNIVFALVKGMISMLVWALAGLAFAGAIIKALYPGLELLSEDSASLPLFDQIVIITLVGFFVAYSYAVLITVVSGSLLRRQSKALPHNDKPALAKWHLPFIAGFVTLTQPVIWLSLLTAGLCKGATYWLTINDMAPLGWASDTLGVFSVFFGFYAGYRHYARPTLEAKFNTAA